MSETLILLVTQVLSRQLARASVVALGGLPGMVRAGDERLGAELPEQPGLHHESDTGASSNADPQPVGAPGR